MDNYTKTKREGVRVQGSVADRSILTELDSVLSLPDYQPEVKRILRVRASVTPPAHYIGAGNAEFSGRVDYSILYAGNDGALYCASHAEDFSFTCPVEMSSEYALGEGLVCDVETLPEHAMGRLSAPRKLSLKCRLRSHVRIYGTRVPEESIGGASEEHTQRLHGSGVSAFRFAGVGEPMQLGDEILYEGNDLRVICAEGQVFVSEASAGSGCVSCRGEVVLKLMTVRDGAGEPPAVQWRRIPFAQNVLADGVEVNCEAVATGVCTALSSTVEEGRMLCEVTAQLCVRAQRNESIAFTRDIYSTQAPSECRYVTERLLCAERSIMGNFSLNNTLPLSDAGIKSGARVVDICISPVVGEVTCERGKYRINGKCRCQALLWEGEEYSTQEFELPFRYACEGSEGGLDDYDVHIEPISCRARMDGERISVDAELAIAMSSRSMTELQMLREASFGEAVPATGAGFTVCYPARDDTLWSVAKRYRRAVESIAQANTLPAAAAADTPESLAGVKYLLL